MRCIDVLQGVRDAGGTAWSSLAVGQSRRAQRSIGGRVRDRTSGRRSWLRPDARGEPEPTDHYRGCDEDPQTGAEDCTAVAREPPTVCELVEAGEEDLTAFYSLPREPWTKLPSAPMSSLR